jgi:site-specific DNA-methyltransferase (adenine-specific)
MVKDLRATIDRQKAPIGIFITLAPATQPMIAEAASAGFYETEYGKYPRLQILTIEELFAGKKPNIPLVDPTAFRKAAREEKEQGKLAF